MKENKKEVKELSKEQEKAIKELVNVITAQEKKEILEKEIIKTKTTIRGKTINVKITKLDGHYIAIVAEKYLITSVKYAKLEEFINDLKIRIHEIDY